jgi:hypothetical protein
MVPAKRDPDRGAGVPGYGRALVVLSVLVGVLGLPELPNRVLAACETAVCRVTGGDDCERSDGGGARLATGAGPRGRPDAAAEAAPRSMAPRSMSTSGPARRSARSPIPKPTCRPGSLPKPGGFALHAHNDYENARPLNDALDNGATSVEADVFLDGADLDVKHYAHRGARGTLEELYLDPLRTRAARNGGRIYPGRTAGPFQLVVELKAGGAPAYERLLEQIRVLPPAVHVVVTGAYPKRGYGDWTGDPDSEIGRQPSNVSFDIPPAEGDCALPPQLDPRSASYDPAYAKNFTMFNASWDDCGDLSQQRLNALVAKAHEAGLRVRFWGGPDGKPRLPGVPGKFVPCPGWLPGHQKCEDDDKNTQAVWRRQMEAGVDFRNTNHLGAGRRWLESCGTAAFGG